MSDLTPFDTSPSTPADPAPQLFDPPRQARFLDQLAETGNVRHASAAAGISPQTAYRARRAKPGFARLWDAALLHARAAVEQVLADRALNGVDEPIYYRGEEIGHRRRYDGRLLLAHLARLDRLAERAEEDAGGNGEVRDFDGALAVLESGEEWVPAVPAAASSADPEEDVPELEAAMRLLEAQGWVDVEGEWQFQGEEEPTPPPLGEVAAPFGCLLAADAQDKLRRRRRADGGELSASPATQASLPNSDETLPPPDPHDFRRWKKGAGARKGGGGKAQPAAPPPIRLQRAISPRGGGV